MNNWTSGAADLEIEHGSWAVFLWQMKAGERVSLAIAAAAEGYAKAYGQDAQFAFIGKIPQGAVDGTEVPIGHDVPCGHDVLGVMMIGADWVPMGWLVLAEGGRQKINGEYKEWSRIEVKNE